MNPQFETQIAPMFCLTGKVALVTGGAVGMGKSVGLAYAAAGATVVLADSDERVAALVDLPAGVSARSYDITSEEAIATLVADVVSECGGVDILVNGAVVNHNKPILETSAAEWDSVQSVNLRAAFITTRQVVPSMQARGGGRIINITTIGSVNPVLIGNGAYSASRAGLNQFTRNCALDFAGDAITANAILPGAIITETIPSSLKPRGPGADPTRHLGGFGKPEYVNGIALLLASPAGRYITGQLIAVDGGFLIS
ncbi:SDR family NAD(P)-dependent oxidoreductase [Novosphingobium taihuense]|uniref:NAD(P)-dependent dehydrogenase (Short-subunit alcohol dehydrogenase family) n=1 Tax=Novosphingobium taihuense TaxID=260085 RepID=A0A7W7AC61_9SPHN|nr:SDR family NAD(P)-dependent oxidoreductase [Novosphingobium taihuense]MBB4614216.1 NAD(P)-dependent dehydrogenase (short-subunit alcohol dehydrogenase family) [Novosphingobium taihuense]TWH87063.1 gluconate 5-dehydrogenase/3-oxoacyl-[acyl-carrier protein] reductase [Novosphingobium taihuense]